MYIHACLGFETTSLDFSISFGLSTCVSSEHVYLLTVAEDTLDVGVDLELQKEVWFGVIASLELYKIHIMLSFDFFYVLPLYVYV